MAADRTAKREMQQFFHDGWKDGLANGLPNSDPPLTVPNFNVGGASYEPQVYWHNIENRDLLPKDEHFAIFSTSNIQTTQRTLPGGRAEGIGARFTTPGVGVVQLFFSKSNYTTEEQEFLCAVAQEMFFGASTASVWFRNPTIVDLAPEESFFKANVTFEFEYDTRLQTA